MEIDRVEKKSNESKNVGWPVEKVVYGWPLDFLNDKKPIPHQDFEITHMDDQTPIKRIQKAIKTTQEVMAHP
jgi:hypothetical protein